MAIKKILVPLDGSEHAEKIGGWLTGIARPLKAEVALVTVVDPDKIELPESTAEHGHPIPGRPGPHDRPGVETTGALAGASGIVGGATTTPGHGGGVEHSPAFGTQILDRVLQQAASYIERESDMLVAAGVASSHKALMGDPAEEIVRHAEEIGADLVAMATHRGSALARGVLGSVTDRVLHSTGIPVMAVHPEQIGAFSGDKAQPESVLVPLDGSKRSTGAIDIAMELAKAAGAEIVFMRVVRYPYYGMAGADAFVHSSEYGFSFQRREAEEALQEFVKKAGSAGLAARAVVGTGSPAGAILSQAESMSRPLIVMSTRGESGIKRWMLGSVTDKVVRSAGLPVVVVPPSDS